MQGRRVTPFPFPIVGFDLDGTLLDTSGDLTDAVNHALAEAGRQTLSIEEVKPMIGGGAKRMLERGLEQSGGCSPELMAETYPKLLEHYRHNISARSVPYPGMLSTLAELDARGVKLAVVTNKFEAFATKLLDELGLLPRFAAVIGGDTMGKGAAKPSPKPIHEMIARCGGGRAAFVGDSIYDTQAARAAGVPSIAVSFGFLAGPVEDLGADAVIDSYAELIPALHKLGEITHTRSG